MSNHFLSVLDQFNKLNILIIGEAFLDEYMYGYAERICSEAPVPIVEVQNRASVPGGAANAAANASAMTAQVHFLSVIGNDAEGELVRKKLESLGVSSENLIRTATRQTITKKRITANNHFLLRFDEGTQKEVTGEIGEQLLNRLIDLWPQMDVVLVSDYGYGILTNAVIRILQKLQTSLPKMLVIDSKHLEQFGELKATAIKPNYKEAVALLGLSQTKRGQERVEQIKTYAYELFEKTNAAIVAITLDAEGALIFDESNLVYRTYTDHIPKPNASGAGDTYAVALALSLAADAELKTAAEIAASAAKVIIKKQGTAICTLSELRELFTSNDKHITNRKQLMHLVSRYKNQSKKIVFTNGCFDLLHSGHVSYLNQAKSYGDVLILGVNTDESITHIKGPDRPINTLSDRMRVLMALSSVDYVVPMPETTAHELVSRIKPDVYVKGGDYTLETLPEAQIVLGYGGTVKLVPTVKGKSTTEMIKRISQQNHV